MSLRIGKVISCHAPMLLVVFDSIVIFGKALLMTRTDYAVSTDKDKLDIPLIHDFLSNRSYWAKGRTAEAVHKTIDNSLCFGIYDKDNRMAGFARVVTDFAIFAYLMDVFILEKFRKQGLGKRLVNYILNYPALEGIRFWRLDTDDAHELYRKYGFDKPAYPGKIMERRKKN